jgi:hypothetical protein
LILSGLPTEVPPYFWTINAMRLPMLDEDCKAEILSHGRD